MRVLVVLALAMSLAGATPSDDLAAARKAFRDGEFQLALEKYNALVRPEIKLADSNDIVEAYVNLGVCRIEIGDERGAKEEFERALGIDPNKQLDPLVITNKRAIRLFDDTKADLRTRADREAEKKKQADLVKAQQDYIKSLRVYKEHPYWMNWFPPLGQFQNGEIAKGIFFGSTELITLGTSAGIWGYLVNKYGIRSDKVPRDEGATVRRLQQIEIGAGLTFFGIYILGVIDAHLHYKAATLIKGDPSLLPPELQGPENGKPKKTSFLRRIHVLPMVTPEGVGVGIGWEN